MFFLVFRTEMLFVCNIPLRLEISPRGVREGSLTPQR